MFEPSPHHLWDELHIQRGNSSQAALLAEKVLNQIDTQNFTDLSVANDHGEYARIAVVTSLAAAKHSRNWPQAQSHILRATQVTADHYPIGRDFDEAQRRNLYWDHVYGEESAQLICLRDMFKLLTVLDQVLHLPNTHTMLGGIQRLLTQIATQKEQRFGLIYIMEEGNYALALTAFNNFARDYTSNSITFDPNQIITVVSRMFGRAFDRKHYDIAQKCFQIWLSVTLRHPELLKFGVVELAKNYSKVHNETKVKRHLLSLLAQNPVAPELKTAIHTLLEYQFVGTGSDIKPL